MATQKKGVDLQFSIATKNANENLKSLASEVKTLNKTLGLTDETLKGNSKSIDTYEEKIKTLTSKKEILTKKQAELQKMFEKAKNLYGENSDEARKWSDSLLDNQKAIIKVENQINSTTKELNDYKEINKEVTDSEKKHKEGLDELKDGYSVTKNVMANFITDVLKEMISTTKQVTTELLNLGMNFEGQMSKVQALSGASSDEMVKLTEKAKEMGEKTKFSAAESGQALEYMALAGWKTEDMLNGLEGIMNLAAASGEELATVSDIVTDGITALGLSAKDSQKFADVFATTMSNSNTTVELLGESFQYTGALAGTFGISVEDLSLSLGLMANAGIKGSQAGTSLRAVITRLATNTNGARSEVEKLGVQVFNSNGTMRDWGDVIADLQQAFKGLSDEEKTNVAETVAGKNAISGFLSIINATKEDTNKLSKALNNSSGSAKKMATTMNNNLNGSLTIFKSSLESVGLTVYNSLSNPLKEATDDGIKSLNSLNAELKKPTMQKQLNQLGNSIGKIVNILIDTTIAVIPDLIKLIKNVSNTLNPFLSILKVGISIISSVSSVLSSLSPVILGVIVGVKTFNTVMPIATTVLKLFGSTASATPFGVILTGIAAVTTATIALISYENDEVVALKQKTKEIETNTQAVLEQVDSRNQLKESINETISNGLAELDYTAKLKDELISLVDENGKVKSGYEDRVNFIVNELTKATGIEIDLINGQIQQYDSLMSKIDEVIVKKKAELIMEANEELYKKAIQQEQEAYDEMYKIRNEREEIYNQLLEKSKEYEEKRYTWKGQQIYKEYQQLQNQYDGLTEQYNAQQQLANDNAFIIGTYEQQMVDFQAGAYDKIKADDISLTKHKAEQGKSRQEIAEENLKISQEKLGRLYILQKQATDDEKSIYDKQIKNAEKDRDDKKKILDQINEDIKNKNSNMVESWKNGLKNQVKELISKNEEFKKAGSNIIDGIYNGINSKDKQNSVFNSIALFGSSILSTFKSSLKEHSPSKASEQYGEFLLQGFDIGVDNEKKDSLKNIALFGDNVLNTFSDITKDINTSFNAMKFNEIITPQFTQEITNEATTLRETRPVILNIAEFNNNTDKDIETLSNELAFYLRQKEVTG